MKITMMILAGLFIVGLYTRSSSADEYQGLKISVDTRDFKKNGEIKINGELSIFVNCGSQYALWSQFPATISYVLKDLDTGEIYRSIDDELSISWDGSEVYDGYAEEPCDKIVTKTFSTTFANIYFKNPPKKSLSNFELNASYLGHTSKPSVVNDASVTLKGF